MNIPCRAECRNQQKGYCRLDDERVKTSRVEFGEDWDPLLNCQCFDAQKEQEKKNQARQQNQ